MGSEPSLSEASWERKTISFCEEESTKDFYLTGFDSLRNSVLFFIYAKSYVKLKIPIPACPRYSPVEHGETERS